MATANTITFGEDGLAKTSGFLTVYNYDPENGVFSGETEEYLTEGVGLPANATSQTPPEADTGKVCVYSESHWQQTEDHRGETVYITATGEAFEVNRVGAYPEGTTTVKPETIYDAWNGKSWVTNMQAKNDAEIAATLAEKASRIKWASSVTQVWQTQLQLNMITPADKVTLTQWMSYIQAVQAVDTSFAPDVNWPEKPE